MRLPCAFLRLPGLFLAIVTISVPSTSVAAGTAVANPAEVRTNKPAALPVLGKIADIRGLSKEAAERELPVVIRAVITGNYTPYGLRNLFIQDESGGIYAYPGENVWTVRPGTMVEVSGTTSAGNFAPEIVVQKIAPIGPGELPATAPVDFRRLNSGAFDSEWVEVAGLVTKTSSFEGIPLLEITDGLEKMRVRLGSKIVPAGLSNAVVRFKGTASTVWGIRRQALGSDLWCPSEDFIQIENRLDRDPFSLPEESISTVHEFRAGGLLPRWTRVRGVVTANTGDGRLVVQSGDNAIQIHAVDTDTPAAGTLVDVVGLRRPDGNRMELYRGLFKAFGTTALPEASKLGRFSEMPPELLGLRKTVEGVLLGFQPGGTTVSLILMGDRPFRVEFARSPETEVFETMEPATRLKISGAVLGKAETDRSVGEINLLAATADDLVVLETVSWWTARHFATTAGGAALVALGAIGWVVSLRSTVRRQSREIESRFEHERELERRNAELVEKAGEIVFSFDRNGKITMVNLAAGQLVGLPLSKMAGRPLTSFLVQRDRRRAEAQIRQLIEGSPVPPLEARCVSAGGGWRWLEVRLQRIGGRDGGFSYGGVARDISDRKLAERARGRSAKNLQRIVESLPDGVLIVDRAGIVRFKNPRARMLLGYDRVTLLGRPVSAFAPPTLAQWITDVLDEYGSASKTGAGLRRMMPLKRPDGGHLQADVSVGMVSQGETKMAMVCFRDATQRLAAEETLRVQALMAGTEAAVARLINTAGCEDDLLRGCTDIIVRRFGAAFARIWTHDPGGDVLVLKASSGMYTHLDGPHSRIQVGKYKIGLIAATREPVLTNDLPNDPRASNPEWAAQEGIRGFTGYPLLMGSELVGVLAVFFRTPPTDQVVTLLSSLASAISGGVGSLRTLAALDRASGKLHAIVHSAPVAIMELDPEGRISDLNPSAEKLFGWNRDEALGEAIVSLVKSPVDFSSYPSGIEAVLERKDGTKVECNVFAAPLAASARMSEGAVCVVLDLSERRRLETESNRIQNKLREGQRLESLGVLAGGIAHDFNNILTSILGNANLASLSLPDGTDASECIGEIERGAKRAAELCRLMLAYAGKGVIEKRSEDISEIVRDTLKLIRHGISKQARLELDLSDNMPLVDVDAAQVRQVVMNLIANASDALGENAGTVCIRTRPGDRPFPGPPHGEIPAGSHIILEIADTGCGMSPEIVGKIFDPFFTTKFTGRGLGLAAVWGIVRGHDGSIAVHSKPGEGSVFRLWLPAKPAALNSSGENHGQIRTSQTLPLSLAVVIDDEAPLRTVTRQILTKFGVKSMEADNGEDGLDLVLRHRGEKPLVFLDLTMPRLGGLEVLRRLRKAAPEVPVVLMSGYSAEIPGDQEEGLAADAFMAKPFGAQKLADAALEALANRACEI